MQCARAPGDAGFSPSEFVTITHAAAGDCYFTMAANNGALRVGPVGEKTIFKRLKELKMVRRFDCRRWFEFGILTLPGIAVGISPASIALSLSASLAVPLQQVYDCWWESLVICRVIPSCGQLLVSPASLLVNLRHLPAFQVSLAALLPQLQALARPIDLVAPPPTKVTKLLLTSHGFKSGRLLAVKLAECVPVVCRHQPLPAYRSRSSCRIRATPIRLQA
jgi:hypothetical protein